MRWLNHVAHYFDATRHFLAGQVHPGNWFGNIVAGVVVFIIIDVCWRLFAKKFVTQALRKIHAEEIARHHREVVKPEADARHREALRLARQHQTELHDHLDTVAPRAEPE
jgi:flagellar biosynthesis/type III secretory pathway M-ring protein FliF/YscJ